MILGGLTPRVKPTNRVIENAKGGDRTQIQLKTGKSGDSGPLTLIRKITQVWSRLYHAERNRSLNS